MGLVLRRDVYSLHNPGLPIDKVKRLKPDPLGTVQYSCIYWVDHLHDARHIAAAKRPQVCWKINGFLREKYLYWLEALSLQGNTTYDTASPYLEAPADVNIAHLESAYDCRRKFVADFPQAPEVKDFLFSLEKGPFEIWCDNLRPANVLLNEIMQIVGVVDWEFTYATPAEFSYASRWWLLIGKPEFWSADIEDWTRVFDHSVKTFKAMKACDDTAIQQDR
ncbi:phosphotransferase enzyme family [Aspergillus udagawae]|uniref:Phosphotransferase enzyme family n=1 Tax=Aspergillus udagawae TaxID=91492 RepID=A0A8H3RI05_9EURO|nr:phosphotransferase enzyme family [Aspergillus udagawae]